MDCLQPLLRGPVGGGGVGGLLPRLPSPVLFPLSKHSRLEETNLLLLLLLGDAVRGAVFGEGGGAPRTAFSKVLLPTVWGRHGGGGDAAVHLKVAVLPFSCAAPCCSQRLFPHGPRALPHTGWASGPQKPPRASPVPPRPGGWRTGPWACGWPLPPACWARQRRREAPPLLQPLKPFTQSPSVNSICNIN